VVRDADERIHEAVEATVLKVFVCGPAVLNSDPTDSLPADKRLRRSVTRRIREKGSVVIWGEHLTEGESKEGSTEIFDDAAKEIHFAVTAADLIIIFPNSPGSWAELGAFSVHEDIAPKMLVFFDDKLKTSTGFVTVAVRKAAEDRDAKIFFMDYEKEDAIWEEIQKIFLRKRRNRVISLTNVKQ